MPDALNDHDLTVVYLYARLCVANVNISLQTRICHDYGIAFARYSPARVLLVNARFHGEYCTFTSIPHAERLQAHGLTIHTAVITGMNDKRTGTQDAAP
jgi:hypothetical protein